MALTYTQFVSMPQNTALIYKIENTVTGSMYIGSTVEPKRRWRNHVKQLTNGVHTSFVLQKAWDKYGEQAFSYAPVIVCTRAQRYFYETLVIKKFGYYNLLKDAGSPKPGSMLGIKHTQQGIENLKAGAKKRWAKVRNEIYDPLCQEAWQLVMSGIPRYKACKQVGVGHSTFWNWLDRTGKVVARKQIKSERRREL